MPEPRRTFKPAAAYVCCVVVCRLQLVCCNSLRLQLLGPWYQLVFFLQRQFHRALDLNCRRLPAEKTDTRKFINTMRLCTRSSSPSFCRRPAWHDSTSCSWVFSKILQSTLQNSPMQGTQMQTIPFAILAYELKFLVNNILVHRCSLG